MDESDFEALRKVPLAAAVLDVLAHVTEEGFLESVYQRHRGRSYTKKLSFPVFVNLIGDALLNESASGRKACRNSRQRELLDVSDQAVYGKLRRIPQHVSQGLVLESTVRLLELFPGEVATSLPESLIPWQVIAMDGKKLKKLAKRLKPARQVTGKVFGGKLLVARNLHFQLAVAIETELDGEANDCPLVPGLLQQLEQLYQGESTLVVADSQFCDLTTPTHILESGFDFLVRYHPKVSFHRCPKHPSRSGKDSQGRPYIQELGYLGSPQQKNRLFVRRITVENEDSDDFVVVTSVLDMDAFPADDLLTTYSQRWSIETMFQHLSEVFCLRQLIGSTAQASIFQGAFCLLLFNILQLVRLYLASQHDCQPNDTSLKNIVYDTRDQIKALKIFDLLPKVATAFSDGSSPSRRRKRIERHLKSNWQEHWLKTPKNIRNPPAPRKSIPGGHTSIHRLIRKTANDEL